MVGAVQDNTERNTQARALREREAHLSTVFGQAMVGIMQTDTAGNIIMVNKRYCEILGRSEENLRTVTMSDCTHRSEEHTSELQSLMRISYAVFCLKKKKPL